MSNGGGAGNGNGEPQVDPTGLDFLNLNLSLDQHESSTSEHLQHRDHDRSGLSEQIGNDEGECEDDAADDALERELTALLCQTSSNDVETQSHDQVEQEALTRASATSDDGADVSGVQVGVSQTQEQYLSGLAAVLQAMQAQAQAVRNTPGFHSLTADPTTHSQALAQQHLGSALPGSATAGGGGAVTGGDGQMSNSDFSELLAHITAQLEQASGQPPHNGRPPENVSGRPGFLGGVNSSTAVAGSSTLLPHASCSPAPTSFYQPIALPGLSGSVPYGPYYTGFNGTTMPSTSTPPGTSAGSSLQEVSTRKRNSKTASTMAGKTGRKEKKVFVCEYCPKSFGRQSDVLRHMRIHTGDRPFPCPHKGCNKKFIQRSALHVHLRVHSGEKPHMCEYPLCERTFSDSSSLARHRRTHTGRRPYACSWSGCTKTFTRRTALTQHMHTHDPNWEPDPNVRYNFKPKKRKTDGRKNGTIDDTEEEEDDDEGEEDVSMNPVLAESVRTLSALFTQTDAPGSQSDESPHSLPPLASASASDGQEGTNTDSLEARVAAISAEIAAAIAQANIQAQLGFDQDDEDEENNGTGEEGDGDRQRRNGSVTPATPASVGPVQQPLQPPPFPASSICTVTAAEQSVPGVPPTVPPVPTVSSGIGTASNSNDQCDDDEEEDIELYVPLRERKSKPVSTVVGSKRKR